MLTKTGFKKTIHMFFVFSIRFFGLFWKETAEKIPCKRFYLDKSWWCLLPWWNICPVRRNFRHFLFPRTYGKTQTGRVAHTTVLIKISNFLWYQNAKTSARIDRSTPDLWWNVIVTKNETLICFSQLHSVVSFVVEVNFALKQLNHCYTLLWLL